MNGLPDKQNTLRNRQLNERRKLLISICRHSAASSVDVSHENDQQTLVYLQNNFLAQFPSMIH